MTLQAVQFRRFEPDQQAWRPGSLALAGSEPSSLSMAPGPPMAAPEENTCCTTKVLTGCSSTGTAVLAGPHPSAPPCPMVGALVPALTAAPNLQHPQRLQGPSPEACLRRCLGPVEQRPSAQELLNDSFFLRRLGKGDSAKSMATMLPAVAPTLTPRSSHRSETEGSDSAIHCQVTSSTGTPGMPWPESCLDLPDA